MWLSIGHAAVLPLTKRVVLILWLTSHLCRVLHARGFAGFVHAVAHDNRAIQSLLSASRHTTCHLDRLLSTAESGDWGRSYGARRDPSPCEDDLAGGGCRRSSLQRA